MLCTFYYDVVTAVCQLLINEYVMLCYVMLWSGKVSLGYVCRVQRPARKQNTTIMICEWNFRSYIERLNVCGPKFMKFSDDIGGPLYFSTTLLDWWCVSLRRCSTLSLEVVEKPSKVFEGFWPQFLRRDDPTFLPQVISALFYCPSFGKSLAEFRLLVYVCKAW